MLIADEVQCGVGRAGSWWACDQTDTSPDILVFAKGIASGYPIAGDSPRHVAPRPSTGTRAIAIARGCLVSGHWP